MAAPGSSCSSALALCPGSLALGGQARGPVCTQGVFQMEGKCPPGPAAFLALGAKLQGEGQGRN